MLKLSIRSVWKHQILNNCLIQELKSFASLAIKDATGETAKSSNSTTMFLQFAKYLGIESYKFDPLFPRTIRYSNYFPVRDLSAFKDEIGSIPKEQLPSLILFAFTYRTNENSTKFMQVISEIDTTCLKRMSEMNNAIILRVLYSLLFLFPDKIIYTRFYNSAIQRLVEDDSAGLCREKFVQVCFYVGLMKKYISAGILRSFKVFLERHLETHVDQLSKFDLAIISNAIYKTSVRVSNDSYLKCLQRELQAGEIDDGLLVNLIKNLRLHRVKSTEICERLVQLCVPEFLQHLKPSALTHIYAYLAENRWDDSCAKNIGLEFISRLKTYLKSENNSEHIRTKDVGMFLWCSSQLNFRPSSLELESLENVILNKAKNGEFKNFPDQLVDCALSLWVLGKKSRLILQETIKIKAKNASAKPNHSKIDTRFTILQSAVAIEYPLWLPSFKGFEENRPVPSYLLKPDLIKLSNQLETEEQIASAKLVCPIYGINIPGIYVQFVDSDCKVFVELLTEDQLLRFSKEPVSILKLKQSLLNALGYNVLNIMPHDINGDYKCLKDLVLKEKLIDTKNKSIQSI